MCTEPVDRICPNCGESAKAACHVKSLECTAVCKVKLDCGHKCSDSDGFCATW